MNNEDFSMERDSMDTSADSIKAGAAVFGNLVFGTEYPEHSLCYSPSPVPNRRNHQIKIEMEETAQTEGKTLEFESDTTPVMPCKNQKENVQSNIDLEKTVKRGNSHAIDSNKNNTRHPTKKTTGLKPSSKTNIPRPHTAEKDSINPTINEARRSKEESINNKILTVAEEREKRRLEKEEAVARHAEAQKAQRQILVLRKQLNERFARAKLDRENRAKAAHLAKVEDEIQFKSQVHVEHKQTLKQMEDDRRRTSMDARAKIRQNNKEGKERMRLAAIAEDQALFEERYESSVATRNTKSENAERRRQSYAFRNGDARRIRELFSQMEGERARREHESFELKWAGERDADDYKRQMAKERRDSFAFRNAEGHRIREVEQTDKAEELAREHESYELKWAGERDADEYKRQMAKERRDSFAFRNKEGHRVREVEATMKTNESAREHESYELKWAGERDADEYRKQMAKERRDSFAFRNAEGHRVREVEQTMKSDELAREHESYELKWAGERDADEYKKQMAKERRDSFAFRNQEGARHDAVMKELKNLAQEQEHESFVLKWAAENDAKQYLADQKELRRQSLEFRNAEGRRHREIDEEMRANRIQENAKNEELAAACQQDVNNYKSECAAKERASLALRGKEHFINRVREENDRQEKLDQDHENHLLDTAAWQDVNDYVEECKQRRRLSLAFRAKEKRRHFEYAKQQRILEVQRQHRDTQYRSEDAHYMQLALLKEKANAAIESFNYSPNCSFGSNPFGALLR